MWNHAKDLRQHLLASSAHDDDDDDDDDDDGDDGSGCWAVGLRSGFGAEGILVYWASWMRLRQFHRTVGGLGFRDVRAGHCGFCSFMATTSSFVLETAEARIQLARSQLFLLVGIGVWCQRTIALMREAHK